jgi:endonuclease-3
MANVFPKWTHDPSSVEIRDFNDALVRMYGARPHRISQSSILDGVIGVILSQNTTDRNSAAAFGNLKAAFPVWELVRKAPVSAVEDAIRTGGLAATKARRIKKLIDQIYEEHGQISLEHLRSLSSAEITEVLSKYEGVGPKTISCVLLFTLGRQDFPVDTHVHRLCQRFGWTPAKASREDTYRYMNVRVPDDIKYELHVNMVRHGRTVCKSAVPLCKACPLAKRCPTGRQRLKGRDPDVKPELQPVDIEETYKSFLEEL